MQNDGRMQKIDYLRAKGVQAAKDVVKAFSQPPKKWASAPTSKASSETRLVQGHAQPDPYGVMNMPVYVTATFQQASATESGTLIIRDPAIPQEQPTVGGRRRRGLQPLFSIFNGHGGLSCCRAVMFVRDEVLLSDDSYGGTYRLLAKGARKLA